MTRRLLILMSMFLVAGGLAGCDVLPARAALPQLHDFGTLPAPLPGTAGMIRVDRVDAPAWIDDGSIRYRLSYDDPTSLRGYADHRWAAPPSDMLRLRLQALLGGDGSRAAEPQPVRLLTVALLEFEQDFPAARQAQARLVVQVSLRDAMDGQVLGQRQFVLTAPSAADVHGAVDQLSALAQQAAQQIATWSTEVDRGAKPTSGG